MSKTDTTLPRYIRDVTIISDGRSSATVTMKTQSLYKPKWWQFWKKEEWRDVDHAGRI